MGKDQVLEVLSHRLGVARVVVLLNKSIEETLIGGPSNLTKGDGKKLPYRCLNAGIINLHKSRGLSMQQRIGSGAPSFRKHKEALSFQPRQKPPADHLLQLTVGLHPIPCTTYPS